MAWRDLEGIMFSINRDLTRAAVRWTKGIGPQVVHLHELERLPIDSSVKSDVQIAPKPIPEPG